MPLELPKHINLSIEHQPHAVCYMTVDQWVGEDSGSIRLVDPDEMVRAGEVWLVHWYPESPTGYCAVAASSLERALAAALESEKRS